jgi:hypothetical protein
LGWIDGMNGRVALLKSLQQYGGRQEVIVHPLKRGSSPQVVDLADMIIDPNGEFAEERASIPYDMVVKGETAAIFQEQDMADFNNQILELGRDTVSINVSPEKEITILDPTSGLETGQKITHGELYAILYSAYIGAALERDQRIIDEQNYIPPEPVPPPGPSEPPF